MFNKQNFCHIASNNRNDVKIGVFVYKTTDDLDTVSASGYFNEKIIDINLHDLIIHEWHDPNDRTKVQYNMLCVVERTLENVGTVVIASGWQQGIEEAIEQLGVDLSGKVSKIGDTMTGPLLWKTEQWAGGIAGMPYGVIFLDASTDPVTPIATIEGSFGFVPRQTLTYNIGASNYRWKELYVKDIWANTIINGNKITIPTVSQPDTFALKSELNAIANSGAMLTTKGVWYAKMDPNSTVPASAEVEGRNYADFTQVDGNNDPIIVIYEYTSGAWTVTDTITPPANSDGYVLITSKIWDIPEQTGQQGGRVYWNHTDQTFTPFPTIISFDSANITNSTLSGCIAYMSETPGTDDVASVGYVQSQIATASGFELFDIKWRDSLTSSAVWKLADGNWISKATAGTAYAHLASDITTAYAWKAANNATVYTTSDTPQVGDNVFVATNGVISSVPIGTISAVAGDNTYITFGGGQYLREDTLDGYFNQESETIAGITITFFRATDGHKICLADQATNVADLYAATGVAWYYVLDTENEQFILPRTQFGFNGVRTNAGDYVAPELPNIRAEIPGVLFVNSSQTATGAATITNKVNKNLDDTSGTGECRAKINIDASSYNSAYQDNGKVQAPATEMYLYFYIGA